MFGFAGQLFYGCLAPHGANAVRLFFHINQVHGAVQAGVTTAHAAVVLFFAPGGVGAPTGVITPV